MERSMWFLDQKEMPTQWYNIQADLPEPLPPVLHPATGKPVTPQDLAPLFPMELIKQEVTTERYIDIPDEVLELYKTYRPSPIFRAYNLEKALGTKSKIYYKYEGGNYSGSHKANTAIAQAYYNKKEGIKRITTETGAGQWGCAMSYACNYFGLELLVFMVKVSYNQKPGRKIMMTISNRAYRIMRNAVNCCRNMEINASRIAAMTDPDMLPSPPSTTITRMSIDFRKPKPSGLM